jgi:hypothetical protein
VSTLPQLLAVAVQVAAAAEPAVPSSDRKIHEVYLSSGFTYFGSDRRVVAGLGGGPGYRIHLTSRVALFAEVRYVAYVGNAYTGAMGTTFEFDLGPLRPMVGLQAIAYGGDSVRVISSARPDAPSAVAGAAQIRLVPLRLIEGSYAVSFVSADVGLGVDAGSRALALTFNLLDIGIQF